jgi:hypothetical protein
MVLDIPNEKEEDLKEKVKATPIDQTIDQIKGTGLPVYLAVAIQDPDLTTSLTNQKLNAIIIIRYVIMLGIAGIHLRRLKIMQIL